MQAIARGNRVYGEKLGGLTVGLFVLADPLATQQQVVSEIERDRKRAASGRCQPRTVRTFRADDCHHPDTRLGRG